MINSSIAFNILVMGSFAFFVSAPISWIILIEQKQKTLPIIYGLALSFNVILNLIFIPKYDYIAAGAITVITECLVVLMLMFVVRKEGMLKVTNGREERFSIKAIQLLQKIYGNSYKTEPKEDLSGNIDKVLCGR